MLKLEAMDMAIDAVEQVVAAHTMAAKEMEACFRQAIEGAVSAQHAVAIGCVADLALTIIEQENEEFSQLALRLRALGV